MRLIQQALGRDRAASSCQDEEPAPVAGLQHRVLSRRAGSADQHQQVRAGEERGGRRCSGDGDDWVLRIADDGVGIDTSARHNAMAAWARIACGSRCRALNGDFSIQAGLGRGTVARGRAPARADASVVPTVRSRGDRGCLTAGARPAYVAPAVSVRRAAARRAGAASTRAACAPRPGVRGPGVAHTSGRRIASRRTAPPARRDSMP